MKLKRFLEDFFSKFESKIKESKDICRCINKTAETKE